LTKLEFRKCRAGGEIVERFWVPLGSSDFGGVIAALPDGVYEAEDFVDGDGLEPGAKRIAVFCPAFTADCLETIEEIGMEGREEFLHAGGESFTLIPCLNDHPTWMDAVVAIAREHAPPAWATPPFWARGTQAAE
jgi:hypothetical protein